MRRIMLKALMITISFSFLLTSVSFESISDSNFDIVPNTGGKLPPLPSPVVSFSLI